MKNLVNYLIRFGKIVFLQYKITGWTYTGFERVRQTIRAAWTISSILPPRIKPNTPSLFGIPVVFIESDNDDFRGVTLGNLNDYEKDDDE